MTYGRIQSVNGPIVRKRIREQLAGRKLSGVPFIVLSLEEMDTVIRLVELGRHFDDVTWSLACEPYSFDPLEKYHSQLKSQALSSVTCQRAQNFLDGIKHKAD